MAGTISCRFCKASDTIAWWESGLTYQAHFLEQLTTQDNRATNAPMFCVFHKSSDADDATPEILEVFLTQKGADAWLEENKHGLKEPWIYVKSGHRNPEWIRLRALLMVKGY